jgi:hypothetical protein
MKKATTKKVSQPKKHHFFVTRRVITETIFEVLAANEGEAVRLAMGGSGEEVYSTTRAELTVEEP